MTPTRPLRKTLPIGNVLHVAAAARKRGEAASLGTRMKQAALEAGYHKPWGADPMAPDLAKITRESGIPKSELSKLLGGTRGEFPSFDKITRLADLFGVRPRWLAYGSGPKREMSALELADAVLRHQKLVAALKANPKRWRASTLLQALHPEELESKTRSDSDGTPDAGWAALLDEIEQGTKAHIDDDAVVALVDAEAGKKPRRPRAV